MKAEITPNTSLLRARDVPRTELVLSEMAKKRPCLTQCKARERDHDANN